jgi:D-amino-acid dehydrogenase
MKYNIPLVAKKKTDVLIVGSGVVGWSIAHQLLKKGIRSTLVDKGDLGAGCSYGNAGWLTPCFAMPLPQPGMLIKSMKWLLDPESPLHIQPRLSMNLAKWMWIFFAQYESRSNSKSRAILDGNFDLQFERV